MLRTFVLAIGAALLLTVGSVDVADAEQRRVSDGSCTCKRDCYRRPANSVAACNAKCERLWPNGCVKGTIRQGSPR
jgi:hypothetical protein